MSILLSTSYEYSFLVYLKTVIQHLLLEYYIKKNLDKTAITDHLKKDYNVDIYDLLESIVAYISISKFNSDAYIITFNKNLKYKNLKLDTLINLIDSGTFGIKGISIFNYVINYVKVNLFYIYRGYLINKGDF